MCIKKLLSYSLDEASYQTPKHKFKRLFCVSGIVILKTPYFAWDHLLKLKLTFLDMNIIGNFYITKDVQ